MKGDTPEECSTVSSGVMRVREQRGQLDETPFFPENLKGH